MNFNRPLIGMDIGESSIKLSVISKKEEKFFLDYAHILPFMPNGRSDGNNENRENYPLTPEMLISLKGVFENFQFKKNPVVVNYTGKTPLIRYLKLPEMPQNEVEEAIKWEAQKLMTEPLETKVIDYAVLQKNEESGKVVLHLILVAVDKSDISEELNNIGRAGIYPRLMDVNPLALLKVVELNHSPEKDHDLIFMDIGSAKMEINICREGVLRFTRQIKHGGNDISRAMMAKETISFDEAENIKKKDGLNHSEFKSVIKEEMDRMVLEVQRSMDYYRTQFRDPLFQKIILMGGTPLMAGFRDYFETHFDLPVVLENPFSSMVCSSDFLKELNPMGSLWAGSIGLALRGKLPGNA
ncbi:MAG: type IV pilus assembly protein PilM [Nitrospirae bacterium]|nr:type IV pilus assembly protein PilM [Nitrospirota bacterium]MBI3352365.1 type IV pilus assembly protein PilM [Nitrospirota bacterium]